MSADNKGYIYPGQALKFLLVMITLNDILHKIQASVAPDISQDRLNMPYRFYISITDDLEETEEYYLDKYGKGTPFSFPLDSYEHGVQLANEIYAYTTGIAPAPAERKAPAFEKKIYLFLYLMPIVTA